MIKLDNDQPKADMQAETDSLFYDFHSEFEAIVMDCLSDKISENLLDFVFSQFDELQENYHKKLTELCEKEGENNG